MSNSKKFIFNFTQDISTIEIPKKLNNPFGAIIPEIAKIAALEFQEYISIVSANWDYDFDTQKGKMFGVLVVQREDQSLGYLGTVSGKLPNNAIDKKMVSAVFNETKNDAFLTQGLTNLASINSVIKKTIQQSEIERLREKRKANSTALQKRIFEHTILANDKGAFKNVLEIFKESKQAYPPAAAGECAAPKLLNFAFRQNLKPIAIAEFWWGRTSKSTSRKHLGFYPACKDKCRPTLGFMLNDAALYNNANNRI